MGNLSNRKKIESLIIETIESLTDKDNGDVYRKRFKEMDDKEFSNFADRVSDGTINLAIIQPAGKKYTATVAKALDVSKKLGFKMLDKMVLEEPEGGVI